MSGCAPPTDPVEARAVDRYRLRAALLITGAILLMELAGGLLSGSLALLADAGHLLSDVAALGVSLFSVWVACRPASPKKTYGYYRIEILSALFNSVLLIVLALFVFFTAFGRLGSPPEIATGVMLVVAVAGLAGNLGAIFLLHDRARQNLNVRGALAHVKGDALASVGVIFGAGLMAWTGWYVVDPLISMGIGVIILVGAWRLLREVVDVLLEATPGGINPEHVAASICRISGVREVHDLHIWSITSGMPALSGHVITAAEPGAGQDDLLNRVKRMLLEDYRIEHTTLQIESPEYEELGRVH